MKIWFSFRRYKSVEEWILRSTRNTRQKFCFLKICFKLWILLVSFFCLKTMQGMKQTYFHGTFADFQSHIPIPQNSPLKKNWTSCLLRITPRKTKNIIHAQWKRLLLVLTTCVPISAPSIYFSYSTFVCLLLSPLMGKNSFERVGLKLSNPHSKSSTSRFSYINGFKWDIGWSKC